MGARQLVADGTFPFETAFRIPLGMVGKTIEFTAVARDTGGNELPLGPIQLMIEGDDEPPTVQIDRPVDGQVFFKYDVVPIEVTALDNVEVASVTFQLGGVEIEPTRLLLMEWQIDAPAELGPHELIAIATDTAELSTASDPVVFQVKDQAISREFTAFNDLVNPVEIRDAISREFTAMNQLVTTIDINDVISREFTAFNDLINPVEIRDAISREFTIAVGDKEPPP